MKHHAYVIAGEDGEAKARIERYIARELGVAATEAAAVVQWFTYPLLSTEDARSLIDRAFRSAAGDLGTILVIRAGRLFHEAQNALLKVFEEPPEHTTLILSIPSEGILLPTLRSRLQPLPDTHANASVSASAVTFLESTPDERAKLVTKLVEKSKSDKDSTKQEARVEAVHLLEGITKAAYTARLESSVPAERAELTTLLTDLTAFMPLLHERSAPLKLIFEHLLIVIPTRLGNPRV